MRSARPAPNEIRCHFWKWHGMADHICVCLCCAHVLSHMYLCASEGVSLEEQVRRIKDIEAIESDSFVPQAFKSSRDDTKVRFLPLPPTSLSLAISISYWICLAAMPPPSVQRQPRPNQTFIQRSPFVSSPNPETVSSDAQLLSAFRSGGTRTKATARPPPPPLQSSCPRPPPPNKPSGLDRCRQNTKVINGASPKERGFNLSQPRAVFWKEARQHATSETRADDSWLRVLPSLKGQGPRGSSQLRAETQSLFPSLLHL